MIQPTLWYLARPNRQKMWLLILLSAILGLVTTIITHRESNTLPTSAAWTTVQLTSLEAEIAFPLPPQRTIGTVSFPDTQEIKEGIFTAQTNHQTLYLMSVFALPESISTDAALTGQLARLITFGNDNQLIDSSSVDNIPEARDFLIQNMDDGSFRQGRIIRHQGELYTLFVNYPNGKFPAADYKHFLQSLTFSAL